MLSVFMHFKPVENEKSSFCTEFKNIGKFDDIGTEIKFPETKWSKFSHALMKFFLR